ncbi:hypothetical protein AAMO2058_001512500 [Amorphochlora amoebiformis]
MWKASGIRGLTNLEVQQSYAVHGGNELPAPETTTFCEKFRENFDDPLIHILCVALVIIFLLAVAGYAEPMEGGGIGLSIIISTLVATFSEYKNENSFRVLQQKASKIATLCLRGMDGQTPMQVPIDQLVIGDIVILQGGDRIPADGDILSGSILVDQSTLNGESVPVEKTTLNSRRNSENFFEDGMMMVNGTHNGGASAANYGRSMKSSPSEDLAQLNRVFRGTVVEEGEAMMRVDCLGCKTVFGKLAVSLTQTDKRKQPLKMKLEVLAQTIARLSYAGSILIAVSFLFKQLVIDNHFSLLEMGVYLSKFGVVVHDVVTAVILAIIIVVCAVPEGLPTMIAVVLSLNMQRLLCDQVLVRHLLGIETSGCLEILFTDKTGTITMGCFSPHHFLSKNLNQYKTLPELPGGLNAALQFCIEASSSTVVRCEKALNKLEFFGSNPTDASLLKFLYKTTEGQGNIVIRKEMDRKHLAVMQEVRFSSRTKFSARRVAFQEGAYYIVDQNESSFKQFIHNPNNINTDFDKYHKERLQARVNHLSSKGQRLVAIAVTSKELNTKRPPDSMILLGVMCLVDKTRPDSVRCISQARKAGVQVVMVTGDKIETASAVAREIGILGPSSDRSVVLTSQEMKNMTDKKLASIIPRLSVVARALPSDKSRLIRVAQGTGEGAKVVGMTGDGINDSAALRLADVSFAMGNGAEVAKEASDIVILDNRLSSIVKSILYGRTIFKTIRKFVMFQSTINLSSTLIVFIGPFMGFDFPLTLIQLLWVNLVMDTLAALAFGGEAADPAFLHEPPLARNQAIISPSMWRSIISNGLYIAFCSVIFLTWDPVLAMFDRRIPAGDIPMDKNDLLFKETAKIEDVGELRVQGGPVFLTAFFSFFIFMCSFNAWNVRTPKLNLIENVTKNMGFIIVIASIFLLQILFCQVGGTLLRTVPLTLREWSCLTVISSLVIPFDLLRKILFESEGLRVPYSRKRYTDDGRIDIKLESTSEVDSKLD